MQATLILTLGTYYFAYICTYIQTLWRIGHLLLQASSVLNCMAVLLVVQFLQRKKHFIIYYHTTATSTYTVCFKCLRKIQGVCVCVCVCVCVSIQKHVLWAVQCFTNVEKHEAFIHHDEEQHCQRP